MIVADKELKYLDLFSGAGGLSEGFMNAGYTPLAHVEIDLNACKTLETRLIYTLELRWWLAGFGSRAEVVEPDELRQHFAKEAQLLVKCYQ